MGCGSSTTVQTISREESRSYSRNTSAKQRQNGSAMQDNRRPTPKSRASSASSRPSSTSSKRSKKYAEERPKSSSSSSSNESRDKKRSIRKASGGSRRSIGSARKTETEQTDVQAISFDNGQVDNNNTKANQNRELDTRVNYFDTSMSENNAKESNMTHAEKHEEKAKLVEEKRAKINEDDEDRKIEEMNMARIDAQEKEETGGNGYTIDDIVAHNAEVGNRDWFKYGRKVYSTYLMVPIVKTRMAEYMQYIQNGDGSYRMWQIKTYLRSHGKKGVLSLQAGYPIYTARMFGVTRKDLKKVLPACFVGNVVDIDRESKLERLKQSVENTVEALGDEDLSEEYTGDYSDQLNRWLQNYPNVPIYNEPPDPKVDPNVQSFPLPKPILFDPLLLRKWVEEWEEPGEPEELDEPAWPVIEPLNESLGDTHEVFANLVKSREDENIAELDMSVDGEAAWNVIEIDIVKNDKTTEDQEKTWNARKKRKNLNDRAWQEKRRAEIANAMIARHEMDPNIMTPYLSFCENLEIAWKKFQELCVSYFVPPKRYAPDTTQLHVKKSEKRKTSAGSQHSDIPNNERDENQSNNITEEQNNAFLTLADDDGDESNQPVVLAEDPVNKPVALTPDIEPSSEETGVSGDQIDDNRNAVDMEPTGTESRAGDSSMVMSSLKISIEKSLEAPDNNNGGRTSDSRSSDRKSVMSDHSYKSQDHGTKNSDEANKEIQNNDFDRLALNNKPNSQTQEEAEQLMNELEFENNSSNGNLEEF